MPNSGRRSASAVAAATLVAVAGVSAIPGVALGQDESAQSCVDENRTIEYWDFIDPAGDNPRAVQLSANIAAFEEQHPNLNVDFRVVTFGELVQRLPQAAAAGEGPDVVKMFNPQVPLMVDAGVYQPLDDYLPTTGDEFLLDTSVNVFDGSTMVLPYEYRAVVLFYRPDLLGDNAPPDTWDELIPLAGEVAAERGVTGFQNGFSTEDNASILMELFDTVMFQQDQPIFDDQGNAVFNTENGLAYFELFKSLQDVDALGPGVVQASYPDAQDGIIAGTAAMATFGSHRITTVEQGTDQAAWKAVPVFTDGEKATVVTGWTLGIGAHSDCPEAAAVFIDYMTSPEAQVRLAQGGEVPSRIATFDDPFFSGEDGALMQALSAYIKEYGRMRTYPESWTALGTNLAEAMQGMIINGWSAEETMNNAVETFNSR